VTRTEALEWLNSQPGLAAFARDCAVGIGDNPAGWLSVIDQAFRATGTVAAGPVLASLDSDTRLLLRYYALAQFADLYALRVDLKLDTVGFDKKKSQAYKAIAERLEEARAAVEVLGYIPSANSLTMGRVTLDFLEPVTLEY
jgi:hypothetical protein